MRDWPPLVATATVLDAILGDHQLSHSSATRPQSKFEATSSCTQKRAAKTDHGKPRNAHAKMDAMCRHDHRSERSLGPSWSLLGRPWGSRARLRWLLNCLLGLFGCLLGRSWALLGALGAPDGSQDPTKRSRTSPLERKRCQTLLARARSAAGRSGRAKTIQMSSKPKLFSFFGSRRI